MQIERAPATDPGLRERKKRARREALIEAAHALVDAHGLDAVTVEAICTEAGVSTRTFFNYFESKDDAVLGIEPLVVDPEVAATFVAGGPSGRLATDLEWLVRALVDRPAGSHRRIACAIELARREPRLLGRQVAAFERHRTELADLLAERLGTARTDPRVELTTLLVMTLTRAAFVQWEAAGGRGEVSEAVPEVLTALRALLAED